MTEKKREEKQITKVNNGMKNGLALISIACLIFIVLGVNHSTMQVNNLGILAFSVVLAAIGVFVAYKGHKETKEGDK